MSLLLNIVQGVRGGKSKLMCPTKSPRTAHRSVVYCGPSQALWSGLANMFIKAKYTYVDQSSVFYQAASGCTEKQVKLLGSAELF